MDPEQITDRIYKRADGMWVGMCGPYYVDAFDTKKGCLAAMKKFIAKRTRIVDKALAAADKVIAEGLGPDAGPPPEIHIQAFFEGEEPLVTKSN